MLDYLIIILPSLIGYGSSMICNVQKTAGSTVSFRPPPFVFAIVCCCKETYPKTLFGLCFL